MERWELCFGGIRKSSRLEGDLDCREVRLDQAGVPNLLTLLHKVIHWNYRVHRMN